jgi:hypothetical protein
MPADDHRYVLLFAAMYFLMIAPQRKKQKEHEKMLKALGRRATRSSPPAGSSA